MGSVCRKLGYCWSNRPPPLSGGTPFTWHNTKRKKKLLCCFFIKRIDSIPKLARHLHLPAHRLAGSCVCVCVLVNKRYLCLCMYLSDTLSGIPPLCGRVCDVSSTRSPSLFAWLDLNAEISMLHTSRFNAVPPPPPPPTPP